MKTALLLNFNSISNLLTFIFFLPIFLIHSSINAQVIGGREPGETAPREIEPRMLDGANFSNSVNTFDGTYNGSYSIGSVSTPGGLSYELKLNYSSSRTTGGTESIVKGIPYGEGWNLNIPRITVESNYFREFTYHDIKTAKLSGSPHFQNRKVGIYEGTVHAHSIRVNIPGKLSCSAIYKYTDKYGWHVFVPDAFENYASIRLLGSI